MSPGELFLWPAGLPVLLLAPAAWVMLRSLDVRRSRRLRELLGPRGAALGAETSARRRTFSRVLSVGGLCCALVATLQPVGGRPLPGAEDHGLDVVVCLDVSRSMLARDLAPSRLQRARRALQELARHARGNRIALVAFAGEARLMSPLTRDGDSLAEVAELVDPLTVQRGGTDLAAALESGATALGDASGEHEVIIVLTDGEDLEGRGQRTAQALAERGITVHCVGFGSAEGARIPVQQGDGAEVFLQDGDGQEVVSVMDRDSLEAMARVTGGAFVAAAGHESPLVDLYEDHVAGMKGKVLSGADERSRGNGFQWPLLAAFVMWTLGLSVTERRRP